MSNFDIIRAWKDEDYRNSLSDEQRSQLPENPAGLVELTNTSMETVVGGNQQLVAGGTVSLKKQTITVSIDVCCSTGDLPCNGKTQDLLCIVY
ncbi:mersacidin/lichenicidin family type 2 lantibiotic [Nostoc spongiaeforme FACHB-130]|uniref:Mersacidin/lichenicidin family type 2 lantibiotic n=1 Tax=Nostoc spongiaeforme FACHB-130 TaxID=1357510 RepID=A0ABR8FTN5_9NOSO|nr:mersacidin/lichenicidin family type 2 lantibiotic [Nostoc spongiaeforme]MBD2593608.1 mersacidin/lichenicidin family type 2 lantibiotic [Nostoc spongiaeforme FACHB-130]